MQRQSLPPWEPGELHAGQLETLNEDTQLYLNEILSGLEAALEAADDILNVEKISKRAFVESC